MLLQETRVVAVCFCTVKVSPTVCDNADGPYKGNCSNALSDVHTGPEAATLPVHYDKTTT